MNYNTSLEDQNTHIDDLVSSWETDKEAADQKKTAKFIAKGAEGAANSKGGGTLGRLGSFFTAGGAASGNPYMVAGGAALSTVGSILEGRKAERQAAANRYVQNEMERRSRLQDAFARMGTGIGSTGIA